MLRHPAGQQFNMIIDKLTTPEGQPSRHIPGGIPPCPAPRTALAIGARSDQHPLCGPKLRPLVPPGQPHGTGRRPVTTGSGFRHTTPRNTETQKVRPSTITGRLLPNTRSDQSTALLYPKLLLARELNGPCLVPEAVPDRVRESAESWSDAETDR